MKKKDGKEKQGKGKVDYLDLISKNLHNFKLTCDYTSYQYTHLQLSNKNLDLLSPLFKQFKYLEVVNISNNSIADLTHLATLPNLQKLIAEHNNIKDFKVFSGTIQEGWKNLRVLNLSFNKISQLASLAAVPSLRELYLTENRIQKVENFGGHPKLKLLELRRNKIASLTGLGAMEELIEIYLADNKIKSIAGLQVPKIQKLHLRKNLISVFDETFPAYEQLSYLNLRENNIEKLEEIQKTKDLPQLKQFIFSQNPFIVKYEFYLFEVINSNLKLKRINKVPITKSLKLRAFKFSEDKWKQEEEIKKKKLEQEERQRLEKQAAQNEAS